MGSCSRPHRQARSGVSYRDPSFDYTEGFCKPQRNPSSTTITITNNSSIRDDSKDPARKNLALKRTSRSKERAEAVHLQIAINESLSKSTPEAINLSSDHDEDEITRKDCAAFQCLLDAAFEAVLENTHVNEAPHAEKGIAKEQPEGNQILHDGESAKQAACSEVNAEGVKCKESYQDKAEDQPKIVMQEDDDSSYEGEEEEEDEDIDTEDESSDLSDELGCKRKRPVKSQQRGKKAANKHNIDNIYMVQVKKARSIRSLSKAEASSAGKSRTSSPSLGKERTAQHLEVLGGKENIATSHSPFIRKATKNKVPRNVKQHMEAESEASIRSCQSVVESEGPWKLSKSQAFDSMSPVCPGTVSFQAQSPSVLHCRVIGLSRRFRPPPLHPYLSKTDR